MSDYSKATKIIPLKNLLLLEMNNFKRFKIDANNKYLEKYIHSYDCVLEKVYLAYFC